MATRDARPASRRGKRVTARSREDLEQRLSRTDLLSWAEVASAFQDAVGWTPGPGTIRTWVAKHQMPKPVGYAPYPPPPGQPYTAMFGKDQIETWLQQRQTPKPNLDELVALAEQQTGRNLITAAQIRDRFADIAGWTPDAATVRRWAGKNTMPKPITHLTKPTGGRVGVYDADEIEAWLQQRPEVIAARHRRIIRAAGDDQELVAAVRAARTERVTWAEIGAALGVTPQAAGERFKHRLD